MERSTSIDIADVIKNYNLLLEFLNPLLACWRVTIYIFSWKNKSISIGVLVMCILIVYNIETVLFSGCLVGAVALLLSRQSFILQRPHVKQRNLKESLKPIHPRGPYLEESLGAEIQVKKTIQEYRHMLMQVNKLISLANEAVELFYRIVRWEKPLYSASLLFALFILCLLSVFVSMRIILIMVTLYLFCANKGFLEWANLLIRRCWEWLQCEMLSRIMSRHQPSMQRQQQLSSIQQQHQLHPHASHEQTSTKIIVCDTSEPPQDQLASSENEEEYNIKHADEKLLLKKVHQENIGSCNKCNVSFAKLLKRKHMCNYCGGVYCGSCTVRVKKSLLGATSPSAYSEVVRVCVDCHNQLEQMQKELTNFQSTHHSLPIQ